jgi:lysophospholipase L1-like esterase
VALNRSKRLLLLVIVQLGLTLGLFEIGVRVLRLYQPGLRALLYEPTTPTRFQEIDSLPELLGKSVLGYRPYEEFAGFVLNSRSLRTREYTQSKEPGSYRVLALGDSFTFGSGGVPHRQHWPTLLEEGLSKRRSERVEVLRLGVGGTSTEFQLRLWQIEGSRLDADAVVVALFVGNDFFEAQGKLAQQFPRSAADRLADASLGFRLLRNLVRARFDTEAQGIGDLASPARDDQRGGYEIPEYAERFDPDVPLMTPAAYLRIESKLMDLTAREHERQFLALFRRVARTLEGFHAEVTETGAKFIVLIIPDVYQVDDTVRDAVLGAKQRRLDAYDLERPQRTLVEFLTARGIDHVDVLPAFRRGARNERLYRLRDTHWSPAGNRLAAELLLEHWDER